ncbi:purple acid phosphatase 26 [Perilla frutescens var. hirtella]|nr:purple acid phosphatase 26 [Perilla frutescens var. hirtella]
MDLARWQSRNREEVVPFRNYLHRHPTPYRSSGSSNPLWYAVRRASAHIIVLSTYSPFVKYTPQWLWLQEEFKRVDREKTPWLIVMMHAPMYNSYNSHFMEGEGMRVVFESWFCRYKVDLVFAGHVHAYERSASYGHSTLEIVNRTHAFYHWNRNDDGKRVPTDALVVHNQYYWRRKQKKKSMLSVLPHSSESAQDHHDSCEGATSEILTSTVILDNSRRSMKEIGSSMSTVD